MTTKKRMKLIEEITHNASGDFLLIWFEKFMEMLIPLIEEELLKLNDDDLQNLYEEFKWYD